MVFTLSIMVPIIILILAAHGGACQEKIETFVQGKKRDRSSEATSILFFGMIGWNFNHQGEHAIVHSHVMDDDVMWLLGVGRFQLPMMQYTRAVYLLFIIDSN